MALLDPARAPISWNPVFWLVIGPAQESAQCRPHCGCLSIDSCFGRPIQEYCQATEAILELGAFAFLPDHVRLIFETDKCARAGSRFVIEGKFVARAVDVVNKGVQGTRAVVCLTNVPDKSGVNRAFARRETDTYRSDLEIAVGVLRFGSMPLAQKIFWYSSIGSAPREKNNSKGESSNQRNCGSGVAAWLSCVHGPHPFAIDGDCRAIPFSELLPRAPALLLCEFHAFRPPAWPEKPSAPEDRIVCLHPQQELS